MKKIQLLSGLLGLVFSTHAQQYWDIIPSGTNKRLMSVSFGSNAVGYVSGADSLLLKTTDGGYTWTPLIYSGINFSIAARDIIHLNFTSANTGFAIVSNFGNPTYLGELYKTTDGGTNWSPVTTGNIAPYRTFFFNDQNGYEVGSAFFAGKAVIRQSGGVWGGYHTFSYDPGEFLYAVDFFDTTTGIVGGNGGYVYRSFDGGNSWDTIKTVIDSAINALKFVNASTILGATDNTGGALIISHDTGKTWSIDLFSVSFFYPYLKYLAISKKDSIIAVGMPGSGTGGVILWTANGIPNIVQTNYAMREVSMRDDSVAFAVGDSGLIMSNLKSVTSTPIISRNELGFKLFPNPSHGIVIAEMSVPHELSVYDIAGKKVLTKPVKAKRHELDIRGWTKGLYFVEGRMETGQKITRRLMVE